LRVLLINSNTKDDLLAAPPIGLCYVAEAAQRAGHSVSVLDLCFRGRGINASIQRVIASQPPDVVGISIRNVDNVNLLHPVFYIPDIERMIQHIRKLTPAPVVLGGSAVSLMPKQLFTRLQPDYIVSGDGEETFPRLLACIQQGYTPAHIPGVGMMRNGKFHCNPPVGSSIPQTSPRIGAWLDLKPYVSLGASYTIQSKRGCRRTCIYCTYNQSLEGGRLRLRSPQSVVDEIEEAVQKYGARTFEFVDSVFNEPLDHSREILEEILRRPWKAHFTAMGVHPEGLDDQYLRLMWRAGFRSFMITPESAASTMLRNYRKGFSVDDIVHAAEAINGTEFAAWWFFMIGGPGETNETLQESLDFTLKYLRNHGRPVSHVAHFFLGVRVYPGTTMWDIAVKEGFVPVDTDPLTPIWYISEELDLERAVQQMIDAARTAPEIYLGFDERVLAFSRIAAWVFKTLGFSRPYWRHFAAANRYGLKSGIRFMFCPSDLPQRLREALRRQGYGAAVGGSFKELTFRTRWADRHR
jgi:radical SAM superfamily enzyme YgiQ (UPF0313 family)